jgi:membrane-bound metal-dependent hydrolase YbcI (DUF457 family)
LTVAVRRRITRLLSPLSLLLAAAVFVAVDVADQSAGSSSLTAGLLDETAHLLTTLFVVLAIGGLLVDKLLVPALIASVAIDLDHIPGELGQRWLTAGAPRPYTHSLLTIAVVLLAAGLWRRRRLILLGVALGLALHFWRDTAEPGTGVALLWPLSDEGFSTSQLSYLIIMGAAFGVAMWRTLRWQRNFRSGHRVERGAEAKLAADGESLRTAPVGRGSGA